MGICGKTEEILNAHEGRKVQGRDVNFPKEGWGGERGNAGNRKKNDTPKYGENKKLQDRRGIVQPVAGGFGGLGMRGLARGRVLEKW
jgi:hypothetical protein